MVVSVTDVAKLTNAKLITPAGWEDTRLSGVASLGSARPEHLSFLSDKKYKPMLKGAVAGAVFVTEADAHECPVAALVVPNPYLAYAKASGLFAYVSEHPVGVQHGAHVHATAVVDPTASIAAGAVVGAHAKLGAGTVICSGAVVGDYAQIGAGTQMLENAVVHHHCIIGEHCVIHSCATIGGEGFGFAPNPTQRGLEWQPIAQLGAVRIGDFVSVGSGTCIDRGAVDDTAIGDFVIIDNLVQIAHNVRIGDSTAIAACTGIAGSTKIGKRCIMAGGVGIAGHLEIVDDVQIAGMCMVTGSLKEKGNYASGSPVQPHSEWRRSAVQMRKLAGVRLDALAKAADQVEALTARIEALESASQPNTSR